LGATDMPIPFTLPMVSYTLFVLLGAMVRSDHNTCSTEQGTGDFSDPLLQLSQVQRNADFDEVKVHPNVDEEDEECNVDFTNITVERTRSYSHKTQLLVKKVGACKVKNNTFNMGLTVGFPGHMSLKPNGKMLQVNFDDLSSEHSDQSAWFSFWLIGSDFQTAVPKKVLFSIHDGNSPTTVKFYEVQSKKKPTWKTGKAFEVTQRSDTQLTFFSDTKFQDSVGPKLQNQSIIDVQFAQDIFETSNNKRHAPWWLAVKRRKESKGQSSNFTLGVSLLGSITPTPQPTKIPTPQPTPMPTPNPPTPSPTGTSNFVVDMGVTFKSACHSDKITIEISGRRRYSVTQSFTAPKTPVRYYLKGGSPFVPTDVCVSYTTGWMGHGWAKYRCKGEELWSPNTVTVLDGQKNTKLLTAHMGTLIKKAGHWAVKKCR